MDYSRPVYAAISASTTLLTCGVWWFAFAKIPRVRVLLVLAITHTVAAILALDNVHLAFTGRMLISFSSSEATLACLKALSCVVALLWIVQACAYLLLVRWIVQRLRTQTP